MTTGIMAVSESPKTLNSPFKIRGHWTDHPRCNLHLLPPHPGQRPTSIAEDWQPAFQFGCAAGFILRECFGPWQGFFSGCIVHPSIFYLHWGSQGFCSERTGPGWTRSHTEKLLFMLTPTATALTTAPLCCPDPNMMKSIWICLWVWSACRGPAPSPQTNSSLGGSFPWPFSWMSLNYASASASQLHMIAHMLFIAHFKWTNTQPSSWKQVVLSA